ncbi:MAG: class I SAM-dependent methyltransferase [Bryobacteraceae bacterium]
MHGGDKMAGGCLVGAMWSYAANVLYPAQFYKQMGLPVTTPLIGELPHDPPAPGLGRRFSDEYPNPVLLDTATKHDHLVEDFDEMSDVYSTFVRPFSTPIFGEAMKVMDRLLPPQARMLDGGCGPGHELLKMARLRPAGEVVGIDLAAGMVKTAHRAARAAAVRNCAFFQSDIGALPDLFNSEFDLVYSCLAHHHYPEPDTATEAIFRCLRPGGIYCVVDPGPEWFNRMSSALAKWADPGWIRFHSPEEFRALFYRAGFARTGWLELLPGFGLALGQKAR